MLCSRLPQRGASAAFVAAGSPDKMMRSSLMTCPPCCGLPWIPPTAYTLQSTLQTQIKQKVRRLCILTCGFQQKHHTNERTFDFVAKLERRRHLRHRQTINASQLCTLPSSHLELGIDIKHCATAEHAQTLPLCLKTLNESNKSMQIKARALNPSLHGHTAEETSLVCS